MLTFILIFLIPLGIGEIITRTLMGKRLLFETIEKDGFYRFKPSQEGWYLYNVLAPARINNVGARGEDVDLDQWHQKQKFFFFGDSFTFGYALQEDETIPYYFMREGNLSPTEVLNFGNSAFGVYHMMRTYDLYQQWMRPRDTIVMIIIEDDFYRTLKDYQRTKLKDFLWRIREHSSFIAWFITASQQVAGRGVADFLNHLKKEKLSTDYNQRKDIFREDGPMLVDFYKKVRQNGQQLVFVFYEYELSDYSKKAQDFCRKNGLQCVAKIYNLFEPLRQRRLPLVCGYDFLHPSMYSNQVVSKGIWTWLAQN